MPLVELPRHSVPRINPFQSFPTLDEAYKWATGLLNNYTINTSVVWNDLFKHARPDDKYLPLLGVERKAAKVCRTLAPEGQWRVESTGGDIPQLQAWYSRFLPYAVAMMESEHGFECKGIEYESVVSIYRTVMGFVDLGQGEGCNPKLGYYRIEKEDCDLFDEIYSASMAAKSPSLPFDEAFAPCVVYVALHKPSLVTAAFDQDCWIFKHIRAACEKMNRPVPCFRWKKTPA